MKKMRFSPIVAIALSLAACATSSQRPAAIPQPDVNVRQNGTLFFGGGNQAPVDLDFTITNRAAEPITVRSIRITSPGMIQYTLRPQERVFQQVLNPGETKTFTVSTIAVARTNGLSATEPLGIRADIDFLAQGNRFHELYNFPQI